MRMGAIFRFQPVHDVHAAIVAAMAARADEVVLGIGSACSEDARNPFSYAERVAMIESLGHARVTCVPIRDLHDGPRWRLQVLELMGPLERFVCANGYVRRLLEVDYRLVAPLELIDPSPISGSEVRLAMAAGLPWSDQVPESVAALLRRRGLVERFRRRYAGETLRLRASSEATTTNEENDHVRVG
jgi:nicotinamide-nucleotide adenylyltransferase